VGSSAHLRRTQRSGERSGASSTSTAPPVRSPSVRDPDPGSVGTSHRREGPVGGDQSAAGRWPPALRNSTVSRNVSTVGR
jgi:hypothetical protein